MNTEQIILMTMEPAKEYTFKELATRCGYNWTTVRLHLFRMNALEPKKVLMRRVDMRGYTGYKYLWKKAEVEQNG